MTTEPDDDGLVPLADGPVCTVWAGVDADSGTAYALKIFPGPLDAPTRRRVEGELTRLARLRDRAPILVADRVEQVGADRWALRMELCTQALPELLDTGGPMPVSDTVALGVALADALAAAHRAGIVHGGVTPGNVLFRPSGEPVLSDFGVTLRRAFPGDRGRRAGGVAPETLRDGTADERSDLYGLGAVLRLARAGAADRTGDRLADLIDALLEVDPRDRPADAATVADRLRALTGDDPPPRPSVRLPRGGPLLEFGPAARPSRRGRVLAGAGAAALLVATLGVVLLREPPDRPEAGPVPLPVATSPSSAAAVRLELAEPVDRGTTVDLSWSSTGADLTFAVIVDGAGQRPTTEVAGRARSLRVPVEPGRGYCFTVQGADSRTFVESRPRSIRGAVCGD
jgi:serine/threonine protein kinase